MTRDLSTVASLMCGRCRYGDTHDIPLSFSERFFAACVQLATSFESFNTQCEGR